MSDQSQRVADYYDVLGVDASASADEVKSAYRRAAMKYHPDRFATYLQRAWATRKMQQVNGGYAVLKDPERRREYDSARFGGPQQGPPTSPVSAPTSPRSQPRPAHLRRPSRLHLIDLLALWNPRAWLAASLITFVVLWLLSPRMTHPLVTLLVTAMLAALLPPAAFLIVAWVTFVLWLNYKASVGVLVDVFRKRFTPAFDTAQTRRGSLVRDFLLRFVLVGALAVPIVWNPMFLLAGYLFYPVFGCALVGATAELVAFLVYAW